MPMLTNSEISYSKANLAYPIFAVDFDPYGRGYLVVGGGGGESKTGVPNKISVLDVSNPAKIETAAEIDLSTDEDSVQSLANLATRDGLITLAGINSSVADQNAGKNEHFRSFNTRYPPRKKQRTEQISEEGKGSIELLGRRSLFKPSSALKKDTFQRRIRLSPALKKESGSKRIGAIASGDAVESEIIVFDATVSTPEAGDIISKMDLPEKAEAADLDIAITDENAFSISYCDDHNIYEQTIEYDFAKKVARKRPSGPRRVHQIPFPDAFESPKSRGKYRAIRFLGSQNVLTLVNKPNKGGAELYIYHLYPTGPAIQVLRKDLPRHIKAAVSLDVCSLDPDKNGNQQFVIAVAGQDVSIEIYTTEYQSATDTFSSIRGYHTLYDVHAQQMTKVCFEPFHTPIRAPDPTSSKESNGESSQQQAAAAQLPGPQYIRLASVSFGNTVVVDRFPLTPLEPQNKNSRYVLAHPNDDVFWRWAYILVGSFVILVTAFLLQSFAGGFSETESGVFGLLPKDMREFLDQPARAAYGDVEVSKVTYTSTHTVTASLENAVPAGTLVPTPLLDLLAQHSADAGKTPPSVLISQDAGNQGVAVDLHADKDALMKVDDSARHWHELQEHEKSAWKAKLIAAGQWAEHQGEAVLQGCLWSTYAGFVGEAAGEILREL